MSSVRTILKNIISLSAAQVLTKLLTLVVTAYTARVLGVEQYGRWSFAAIFASYFSLLSSLGVDAISSRHIARDRNQINRMVRLVVPLRFLGSVAGLLAVGLVVWWLPKPVEMKWLILACYVPLALGFWNLMWVFIGLERLELVALSQLLEQLANAGIILLLVRTKSDVFGVPAAAAVGGVAGAALLMTVYAMRYRSEAGKGRFDRQEALALVRETLPFGLTQVLSQMYYNFDSVLLSFMRTDAEVGWYNAAYKLLLAVISFRYTIIYSLNPTFARLFAQSPDEMQGLARHVQRLAVFAAVPLGVGGMLLARPIIGLVFGKEYAPAADALRVLVWSPAFLLVNLVGPILLSAAGRWNTMLKLAATVVAVNVAANLVMIPHWGIVGAAWATLLADVISLVLHRLVTRKLAALPLGSMLVKPALCAVAMGLFLWPLRSASVLVTIPAGACVYAAGLLVTGAVKWSELRTALAGQRL